MTDIVELEQRITTALDRIGRGLEAVQSATPAIDPGEVEALKSALDEERTANAQLEERVKAIREKQEQQVNALQSELAAVRAELGMLHGTFQTLDDRMSLLLKKNAALAENNAALREAAEAGVADAAAINTSLQTELEALRAAREADQASLEAALAVLEPLAEAAQ
ncbi:hypothetical protein [Pseudoprimorskyibacter insulae]|uniref:Chromosome partition protein Smc n=1 Tax=Pseudoprimorskyibacter insulae TaxID=1695997 RepID=A0A2R8AXH9_9RHOB|nr:hypothetical protein [Pseudoprimorskyibacter insulae]SPF80755.1 hypothetical protein PRI8871_02567 [Pseudoprimorskyibacter insulae]